MRGSEVRDCRCQIGVELDRHASRIVREKMGIRRIFPAASDHEAQMLDVPSTHRARVWNVESEMLEDHDEERRIRARGARCEVNEQLLWGSHADLRRSERKPRQDFDLRASGAMKTGAP